MAVRTILRITDVEKAAGQKRSQIYRLISVGQFPRPVRISPKSVGWYEDEVLEWQESRQRTEGGWCPRDRKRQQQVAETA